MEKTNMKIYKFSQRSGTDLSKFTNYKKDKNTQLKTKNKSLIKSNNNNNNNFLLKSKNLNNESRKNNSSNFINLLSPSNNYQQNLINFLDENKLNSQSYYFLKKYNQLSKQQKNQNNNKSANSSNLISNIPLNPKTKKISLNKSPNENNRSNNKKIIEKKEKLTNIIRITEYNSNIRKKNRNKSGYNKSFLYLSGDETNLSLKNATTTANTSNNIKSIGNELKLETLQNNNNEIIINIEQLFHSKKNNKLLKLNDLNFDIPLYPNFQSEKIIKSPFCIIDSYCMNSYKGLFKDINEDYIISLININKPNNYIGQWPNSLSYFAIFDGHCGITCSEYLMKNLHNFIFNNQFFPNNPIKALEYAFDKAEEEFYMIYEKSDSGSCAIVCLLIDDVIYVANLGDSRLIISNNNGKNYRILTNDHNLYNENERKRIEMNGSTIYQEKIQLNQYITNKNNNNNIFLVGPYRINPGGLSITRSIGDFSSKILSYGGMPNTIIPKPEIISYKITSDTDFIFLASDGIFNVMKNIEIIHLISEIKDNKNDYLKSADLIIKNALKRNSTDNLSCIVIFLKNNFELTSFKERDSIDINAIYMETESYEDEDKINILYDTNDDNRNKTLSKFISSPKTTKTKCCKSVKFFGNKPNNLKKKLINK